MAWLATAATLVVAFVGVVIWLRPFEEEYLRGDYDLEQSLLEEALAEIDRPVLLARHTGDLDAMIQRRVIRVLVTYNKTNFFIADGEPRGFEYELLEQYKAYLKTRVRKRSWPTVFLFIPVPFDQLLPALVEGRGDIAAAGLTVTPEREEHVAFTAPYIEGVREIVVTAPGIDGLERIEDLSGREVYVNQGTSYAQSLRAVNEDLEAAGLAPVEIIPAHPTLATEDILELVNAGVVPITISDNHIAELWAKVLPNMVLRSELAVRNGGRIAWALRKDNPELLGSVNQVLPEKAKGTLIGNLLFDNYFRSTSWIESALSEAGAERLARVEPLFRKYAEQYGFDWLQIAALAYQESRLDHSAKSGRGAVGIMQVLPGTAKDKRVDIADIDDEEGNIHAGVKYLAYLRDSYFDDPEIEPAARLDFALAAYNAGPSRIKKLRSRAEKDGLDPNRWFANVEHTARRAIGRETVDYVANINKYFVAYKLSHAALGERQRVRDAIIEAAE